MIGQIRYDNPDGSSAFETEEDEDRPNPDSPGEAVEFRRLQLEDETGFIPADGLIRAAEHVDLMRAAPPQPGAGISNGAWTSIGPGNIGGRIRAIVIHPTDANQMWIGSVSGGIWKTNNGGASWAVQDDFMTNMAVSTMVMDPTAPNTLYAGTGEGFYNADGIRGAGVFKTTDGGTTWSQLSATNTSNWYYVNRLAIHPNGQILLAATRSGIWRTINGGTSWTQIVPAGMSGAYGVQDINFDPADGNKAVASSNPNKAWYSTDGGVTWTAATGIPVTAGRVEVAYAPNSTSIVYASVEINSGEIYKSTDGGQTYTLVNTGSAFLGGQGWYDNIIWVDPTNPNTVVVGGIDLWRSTNGGATLTRISNWQDSPISAHADHHAIVEHPNFNGSTNTTVFFGNDGGIYKAAEVYTVVGTTGWQELNNGLSITQFYGAAANSDGKVYGGTQDNGALFYAGNSEGWIDLYGGDGGFAAADPINTDYLYGEYIYLRIHRDTAGGDFPFNANDIISGLSDANISTRALFIAPFILNPNDANIMLAGGSSLWRSTNVKAATPTWTSIKAGSTDCRTPNNCISAIAVALGDSDIIWVGHQNGDIYKTTNGTSGSPTWTQMDTMLPNRYVTRITIDPQNSNIVYATFGGFSADNIYRTTDGGSNWSNITDGSSASTSLPNVPVRDLDIYPTNSSWLYAATEVGIFTSEDNGANWTLPHDGPNNTSVDELFWFGTTLYAATHGRGIFQTVPVLPPTTGTIRLVKNTVGNNGTFDFTSADTDLNAVSIATTSNTGQSALFTKNAASYTVSEDAPPANWALTALTCTGDTDNGSTITVGSRQVVIDLDAGENIVCTFTNTFTPPPTTGTIQLVKNTVGNNGTFAFTSADTDLDAVSIATVGNTGQSALFTKNAASYTVSEDAPPANWALTALTCAGDTDNGSTITVGSRQVVIDLDAGENIVCTFTNTFTPPPTTGTIQLVKTTVGNNGTFAFTSADTDLDAVSITTVGNTGQSALFTKNAASYTVSEDAPPANWALTALTCAGDTDNGSTITVGSRQVVIDLDAGENIVCTFTNTFTPPPTTGTIQLVKNTVGNNGTFAFTSADTDLDAVSITTVGNTGQSALFTKNAASYTVSEDAPPANWALTALTCAGDTDNGSTITVGSRQVVIDLDAGENIVCTFTNTFTPPPTTGTIIIHKTTSPAGGTGFGFTSNIPSNTSFTLDHGQNRTVNSVAAGAYTVSENAPSGYTLTNLTCTDPDNGSTVNLGTRTATIDLDAGETVDCTFTNTQNAPTTGTIIIRKTTSPAGGTGFGFTSNVPGATSFTLNHGQNRTVNSVAAGSYTVSENNPSGYSLTNLVCTDPTTNSTVNVGTRTATINLAAGETVDCTFTNTQAVTGVTIMISSDENGKARGLSFRDEDIMAYNTATGVWSLLFDGSDVGLGNSDVDAFAFLPNGQLLLSVEKDFNLSGFGAVDDSDILKFIPSSYGNTTSGSYLLYFDGSDVGLDKSDEDVDAIDFDVNGNLLISVDGSFKAQSVTGNDEDLFVLTGFVSGPNTSGTWGFYFDGSDVGLSSSGEDIFGLWADHVNSKLYLSTHDNFSVPGASGDEDDIFVCRYTSLGNNTACTFTVFWNGDTFGFDEDAIDGLSIGTPPAVVTGTAEVSGSIAVDDTVEFEGDDINEPNPLDGEEIEDEETLNNLLFLPFVQQ